MVLYPLIGATAPPSTLSEDPPNARVEEAIKGAAQGIHIPCVGPQCFEMALGDHSTRLLILNLFLGTNNDCLDNGFRTLFSGRPVWIVPRVNSIRIILLDRRKLPLIRSMSRSCPVDFLGTGWILMQKKLQGVMTL